MNNNRMIKEQKVAEIKEKLEKSQAVILSSYQGLTVEEDTQLRKTLREAGVEYRVYKNTLVTLAARELGMDAGIEKYLEGPVSIAFGYDDATAPARILNDFAKDHNKLELKAGIVEGKVADAKELAKYASIPSRETLLTMIAAGLKSPLRDVAICLDLYAKQKQEN